MVLPDNRIRFSPTTIDFENEVGITGQDHDGYPAPQTQARYDHMRMVLIALLSNQSSYNEPNQYRDGTLWFDLNTLQLKIRKGLSWVSLSEVISLEEDESGITTLSDWFNSVSQSLGSLAPEITFSGIAATNSTTLIIPESLRIYLYSDSRPFVYKNGLLLDPRTTVLDSTSNPTTIISQTAFSSGDNFTVLIKRIPSATWYGGNA